MTKIYKLIIIIIVVFGFISCEDPFHQDLPKSDLTNLAPETYVSLFFEPDTILEIGDYWVNNGDTNIVDERMILGLDTMISKQHIYWWGEDPDGEVTGYYYQWSYMDSMKYVESESEIFYLPLRSLFDIYTFKVWAVDNNNLIDPSAAQVSIPVRNTPPRIEWKLNTLPPVQSTADVTHTSFTHHSFFWDVDDLDGLETVTDIYWTLDDTTSWNHLDGESRTLFIGKDILSEGFHTVYFKARDIAGAYSKVISFPDSLDENYPNKWYVKEPIGDYLIVNDYAGDQLNYTHQNFYKNIFTNIVGEDEYSVWEIGGGRTNVHNSIPYATKDIEENLNNFKNVFWFTYRGDNSISESALALTRFVADGGILFMDNAMKDDTIPDTSWTFTSIDTVYSFSPTGRIFSGTNLVSNWNDANLDSSLSLFLSDNIADRLWAVIPGTGSILRYSFEDGSLNNSDYLGTPPLMIETPIGQGTTYYFTLPLTYCNGNDNVDDLFKHIFEIE